MAIKFSGVASGSATTNSGIFWTRTWDSSGTELSGATADLNLEVSVNADFSVIAFTKSTATTASSDFTTKVDLSGLSSGTNYYYRFKTKDATSISDIGQFKTAPAATNTDTVRFGHAGDVDGLMAPYLSTQDLIKQKLDFFIFNGDTIYETVATGSPATAATKDVELGSIPAATLLADYRRKYLETHQGVTSVTGAPTSALGSYQGLDTFFAAQGLYVATDNHEYGNKDIINGGAPLALRVNGKNGSTNTADDVNTTGTYIHDSVSFKTLTQAFLEYQPIRTPETITGVADSRALGTSKLYGAQQWGKNVIEINLDTRTYRDVRLSTATGDDTGSRADNPGRTLLGKTQLAWLKQTLLDAKNTGTAWKFINTSDPIDQIGPVGSGEDSGKSWMGGYRAERNDLLKFIADNGITNVVFLSSDDHQGRINDVLYVADPTKSPTDQNSYVKVPGVLSITDGPIGATGPDLNTDHSFSAVKKLADALASKQISKGVDPIGLDPQNIRLFNVWREGDSTASIDPKPVDFYSADTFNFAILEVTFEGVLNVTLRGVDSYAKNSFPVPSDSNQPRDILRFSIDVPSVVGSAADDTNTPGSSTIPFFTGRNQNLATGSGNDEIDVALVNGQDNKIFAGSGDDMIYAGTRDVITGGSGNDEIWAIAGDGNRLSGNGGDDAFIIGSSGNRALGGDGNDIFTILESAGTNYLNGGSGSDQFWLISGAGDKPAAKQFVMDFKVVEDKVGLRGATFTELAFTQVGGDTLLSVTGTVVGQFMNITVSTLNNQTNFLFN